MIPAKIKNASPAQKDLHGKMPIKKMIAFQYSHAQIIYVQIAHLTLAWMIKIISACNALTIVCHVLYKVVRYVKKAIMSVKENVLNAPKTALLAMMLPTVSIVLLAMSSGSSTRARIIK